MNKDLEKKIKAVIEAAGEIKSGAAVHIDISHDEGCKALKTMCLSDCTCKPTIKKMAEC